MKGVSTMKEYMRFRKVLSFALALLMFAGFFTNIGLIAKANYDNEAAWTDVLNTDLSEYEGERIPYMPNDTRQPVINDEAEIMSEEYQTDRFIVKYKEVASEAKISSIEQKIERRQDVLAVESLSDQRVSLVKLEEAQSAADFERKISSADGLEIEYIQPDYEMRFYSENLQLSEQKFQEIDLIRQAGAIVALLDTGIDDTNAALSSSLVAGYDFVNRDSSVNDSDWYYDQGHGTSMAGIIAAAGAQVMPLKIFQGGKAYTSDIIDAIAYAEANGASIANMSFGGRHENRALFEAMENSEMLFVCATGNLLVNIDNFPIYPAAFDLPNVISVASVDEEDKLSRFSNYGPATVDVAARGENIAVPGLDNQMIATSGTSASAAMVSGLAAQILETRAGYTATELKGWIVDSSVSITGLQDKIVAGKRVDSSYALSAASLPNNQVLDIPDDEPLPEVELDWEPEEDDYEEYGADGLISYRTSMPTAREGLGVVAVGKKIYAIGGQFNTTYYNKVEIYDTETDTWTTGANMTYGVSYFSCVAIGTNIYCFGGYNGSYRNYVQVYSTTTNTWSAKTAMPQSLMATAAVVYNGNILVTGGYNGTFRNYVYQYNVSANTWTQRGSLLAARAYHNALVYNGKIYIEGGCDSLTGFYLQTEEQYNLSSFTSSNTGMSRVYGTNTPIYANNSRLVVLGGSSYLNKEHKNDLTVRSLLDTNITYRRQLTLGLARSGAGCATVDGKTYLMGGANTQYTYNAVEVIDWGYTELSTMPVNLQDFQSIELGGKLYVFGGQELISGTLTRSYKTYIFDLVTETWTQGAMIPNGLTSFVVEKAYGSIYLFAGNKVYQYSVQGDSWSAKANATNSVLIATAYNGKIYCLDYNGKLSAYDPLSNSWAVVSSQATDYAFSFIAATDYLYAFCSGVIYRYDFSTGAWTSKTNSTSGPNIVLVYNDFFRVNTALDDNRVTIWRYSWETNTSTSFSSFHDGYEARLGMCSAYSRVFMFLQKAGTVAVVEYIPPINPWLSFSTPSVSHKDMAVDVIGSDIFMTGGYGTLNNGATWGYIANTFSYSNNTWANKQPLPLARSRSAHAVAAGKWYIIAGETATTGTTTNRVDEYNPSTNAWTQKAVYPYSLSGATAAEYGGKVYVFGGKNGTSIYNYVREYNPQSNTWAAKTNMPTARYDARAVLLSGKIYVVGGYNSSGTALTTVEVYDPVANTWATKAALPAGRANFGIAADNGIYVVGGNDGFIQVNTVFQYNPSVDRWYNWVGSEMGLEGHGVVSHNGGIYSINGMSNGAYPQNVRFTPTESIADNSELLHYGSDLINPSGNLARSYADLAYDAPGFTVNFGRTYNSKDTRASLLSPGWSFSFQGQLEVVGNDTTIRMPDGSVRTFKVLTNGTYQAKDSRATLVKSGSTHILTTKDHYAYRFNANGYLYQMTDPNGNIITITVDGTGKVTQVADQAGRSTTVTYTSNRISKITDPVGRIVSYTYDGNGRLSQVTGPDGSNTYYTYNAAGLLYQVKNHGSVVVESFTYETPQGENQAKVKTVTTPTGVVETYTYDKFAGTVSISAGGRTTVTYHDKALYPILYIDAEGGETRTEYGLDSGINRYGEARSETDRNGNATFYDRDTRGNIVKIINPDMSTRLFTYDQYDNMLSETDERGHKTFYVYDSNHNLLKVAKPLDGVTAYTTTANQSLFSIVSYTYYTVAQANTMCGRNIYGLMKIRQDAGGNTVTYTYNTHGYLLTATDSLNRATSYAYNTIGWLKSEISPRGYTTTNYYDKAGRLLKQRAHGGETTRYFYDEMGNLKQQIEPKQYAGQTDAATFTAENIVNNNSYSSNLTSLGYRSVYNKANQVTSRTNPLGQTTSYQYDTFGNCNRETLPNGLVYTYTHDKLNRVITRNYLEGSTVTKLEDITYIALQSGNTQQKSKIYFSNTGTAETIYTYDFANRLIKTQNPDGGIVENTYLPNGLLASTEDAEGNVTLYEYTPMNQRSAQWAPFDGSLYSYTSWEYNPAGRVSEEKQYVTPIALSSTASGAATTKQYTYFIDGALNTVTTNGTAAVSYAYDSDGNRISESTLISSNRSRLIERTYNYLGKVATEKTYHEKQDIDGENSSTDLLAATTQYAYDANGNLVTQTAANGQTITYIYDNLNRQLRMQRTVLNENNTPTAVYTERTYDSVGNILTECNEKGQTTTYTYTALGFRETIRDALNGIQYQGYDRQGRVIKQILPGDYTSGSQTTNYTTFAYDGMNRLLTKTVVYQPIGGGTRSLVEESNTYNFNSQLLTRTDGMGNAAAFSYDSAGRQVAAIDPEGNQTSFVYDALGRAIVKTDARGISTESTYDLFGNLTAQSTAGIAVMSATHDLVGNVLSLTDANGNSYYSTYTLNNQVRTKSAPGGYQIQNWYDIMGNLVRSTDSEDKEIISQYDGWGRLQAVTQQHTDGSQGITQSTRYDVLGNPVYQIDGRGNATQYTYDALSRVTAVINPLNQTTGTAYDANGNKTSTTDWRGNTTTYQFDKLNRLVQATGADGVLIEQLTYYDNHSQHTSTDALGNTTTFFYDGNGRLVATQDAEGYTSSKSYDSIGNVISQTDGRGMTTELEYDSLNNLVLVTDPTGAETSYSYDANGNMLTQTDANGNTTSYVYNSQNLPILRADPGAYAGGDYQEGYVEYMSYTPDGKLSSATDKNGVTTVFVYDVHGRLIEETAGSSAIISAYDANGNLLTVQDDSGTTTRVYDALNRCTSKSVPGFGTTAFAYDITAGLSAGHVGESTTLDGRTTTKVYDKQKRLYQMIEGTDVSTYAYYANGNLQSLTMPNGIVSSYTYYDNGRLHTLQNVVGSTTIEAYSYAYDGAGNMTAKQDGKGTTVYTYSDRSQMLTVVEPTGRETVFEYDSAGNRTRETITEEEALTIINYTVDARNRLTKTTEISAEKAIINTFFYDAAGNMTGRRPEKLTMAGDGDQAALHISGSGDDDMEYALYGYNERNQMISANTGGTVTENTFNTEGYRASKTADGVTTEFLYEYDRIIKEVDSEGGTVYNDYGTLLLSRTADDEKVWYLYNGHGDVTALVNSSGQIITTYYYDAFGVILEESAEYLNPYRYAGYYYDDESKLYDLRARFYDAKLARFMQEDTYRGSPEDPLSLNLYMYCFNNPLIYHDPTGHNPLLAAIAIAATVSVAAGIVTSTFNSTLNTVQNIASQLSNNAPHAVESKGSITGNSQIGIVSTLTTYYDDGSESTTTTITKGSTTTTTTTITRGSTTTTTTKIVGGSGKDTSTILADGAMDLVNKDAISGSALGIKADYSRYKTLTVTDLIRDYGAKIEAYHHLGGEDNYVIVRINGLLFYLFADATGSYSIGEFDFWETAKSQVVSKNDYLSQAEMKVNASYISMYLLKRGWSREAIAALLGNMEAESTIGPGRYQGGKVSIYVGFGLTQWTSTRDKPHDDPFFAWADQNKLDPTDIDAQLQRLLLEVSGDIYQWQSWRAKDAGKESSNVSFVDFSQSTAFDTKDLTAKEIVERLAVIFLLNYERPSDKSDAVQNERKRNATKWFDYLY